MKITKEDLKQFRYAVEWAKERENYIEEKRARSEKTTSNINDMPNGNSEVQDKMAENIVEFLDDENELSGKVKEIREKEKVILMAVERLDYPYRLILEKRYINGKSIVNIADEMGYNYEYTKKMNGIALRKFEMIEENEKK